MTELLDTFPGGVRHPPLHPNCRCALVAWRPEWDEDSTPAPAARTAKDPAAKSDAAKRAVPKKRGATPNRSTAAPKKEKTATPGKKKSTGKKKSAPTLTLSEALREGDFTAARKHIVEKIRADGMAVQERFSNRVEVEDLGGVADGVAHWDGRIGITREVADDLRRLPDIWSDADKARAAYKLKNIRDHDFAELSALQGSVMRSINSYKVLVHEAIHNAGTSSAELYRGAGAVLEEVTTEVNARRLTVDHFGLPQRTFMRKGAYQGEIGAYTEAVRDAYGLTYEEAWDQVSEAAHRYKKLERRAGAPRDVIREFADLLPEGEGREKVHATIAAMGGQYGLRQ